MKVISPREYIFEFLTDKKIKFMPLVNWPERGLHGDGNSVPRWHIAWGTGYEIIDRLLQALDAHPRRGVLAEGHLWGSNEGGEPETDAPS